MIKNIYKWTGVLYDIANMPWMHHQKRGMILVIPFFVLNFVVSDISLYLRHFPAILAFTLNVY